MSENLNGRPFDPVFDKPLIQEIVMGTLENHDNMTPTSRDSKVVTSATSVGTGDPSKHHDSPQGASTPVTSKVGMGSDRLPQGKLDTPKVP